MRRVWKCCSSTLTSAKATRRTCRTTWTFSKTLTWWYLKIQYPLFGLQRVCNDLLLFSKCIVNRFGRKHNLNKEYLVNAQHHSSVVGCMSPSPFLKYGFESFLFGCPHHSLASSRIPKTCVFIGDSNCAKVWTVVCLYVPTNYVYCIVFCHWINIEQWTDFRSLFFGLKNTISVYSTELRTIASVLEGTWLFVMS